MLNAKLSDVKGLVKTFDARVGALAKLDGQSVAAIITAASDIALVMDDRGIIRDIAVGGDDSAFDESRAWMGQGWQDTVTPESRVKIDEMLKEVASDGVSRRRQVNHPSQSGPDIPIAYSAVRLGRGGELVAIGRDLRAVSALQQRLVEAQQSLERDYWRMRHIETRYRLLFHVSSEPVLVVDAATLKVVEANPAAAKLFGTTPKRLISRVFPFDLQRKSAQLVERHLASVRSSGRADEVTVRLEADGSSFSMSASLVRQDNASLFLIRLAPQETEGGTNAATEQAARLVELLQNAPDGFVLIDFEGKVINANRAFLDMAQLATEDQARGQPISEWLGRPGADLTVLLTTLRGHGVARLFTTALRGQFGSLAEVELSAVAAPGGEPPCIGMTIRDVGRRLANGPEGARDLTQAVEQLTGLVGRVALRTLVRDTSDLVERHFVEAALELAGDNRTSAAEILGVSRQSLYVKLRRFNLLVSEGPTGRQAS